jgi:CTP synthase (UTP-ammonia lyase)
VKELTGFGIQPDILLCRAAQPLDKKVKSKIALFCNVDENRVISAPTSARSTRCRSCSTRTASTSASSSG